MCAAIRELGKNGHAQCAVYGLNEAHAAVDVGCPGRAVRFSRQQDGQPLFGMSDLMPYDAFRFCDMTPAQYKIWAGRFLAATREAIRDFRPDVILGHHLHLLTALVHKNTDVPVVGVCHGTDLDQLERNPRQRAHVKKYLKDLPLVLSNSPAQHARITRLLGIPEDRMRVLGGGCDPSVFYPGNPPVPPPFEIVYTGKISEHKGIRPLFYALGRLPKDTVRLTIAGTGEGEETDALKALGERLSLPVRYAGFLSQEALGDLYRQSHLFVLPSYKEGLSLATLEALGSGLSCVVMDWPNLQAFLPSAFSSSGQITFVPRISDTPVSESHPRFDRLVDDLAEAIETRRTAMFSAGTFSGIIPLHDITWAGRIRKLEAWLSDIV